MFRCLRCHGGLRWFCALAHVHEIGFRAIPPPILRRPWLSYLRGLVPDLYVSHFKLQPLTVEELAVCNVLQTLQLIFNVGLIILGNGQGLSQMAQFKVCICTIQALPLALGPYESSFASVFVISSG